MRRLISGMEAVQAGLTASFCGVQVVRGLVTVAALKPEPNRDAFRLWRSIPGYRKACRMLRRSGRVIMHGAT